MGINITISFRSAILFTAHQLLDGFSAAYDAISEAAA